MIAHEWTRRRFLQSAAAFAGAGILQPLAPLIAAGKTIEEGYPEDVLDIEKYTKGTVKPGMIIGRDNADLVKDIAPLGLYQELKKGNTKIKIAKTDLRPETLVPIPWIETSLKNKGQAILDKSGQVWHKNGQPWIGGDPFMDPDSALEAMWDHGFNIRRYDDLTIAISITEIDPSGTVAHSVNAVAYKIQCVGRMYVPPEPLMLDYPDNLFRQVFVNLSPFDISGLASLSTVYYDATKYPGLDLYIPTLKRTHSVPTTQRFDTLVPYGVQFVSDFDIQGDPLLTWSWTLVGRKPFMLPSAVNLGARLPGAKNDDFVFANVSVKFPNSTWELRPDMLFIDGICHIPGCPYGKKRVYFDMISRRIQCMDLWDKAGRLWRWEFFIWGPTGYKWKGYECPDLTGLVIADGQADYHEVAQFGNFPGVPPFAVNTGLQVNDHATAAALQRNSRR